MELAQRQRGLLPALEGAALESADVLSMGAARC